METDDDSNVFSRLLERAAWRREVAWQRIVSVLKRRPDEPFHFLTRGRQAFDLVFNALLLGCIAVLLKLNYEAVRSQKSRMPLMKRKNSHFCLEPNNWVALWGVCVLLTLFVHGTLLLISSTRFELVYPARKLCFEWRRRLVDPAPYKHTIAYSPTLLAPTTNALREALCDVAKNQLHPDVVTKFLLSKYGRSYLNRAARRVHDKLALYDNRLVRVNRRGTFSFFLVSLICVYFAVAAAFEDSGFENNCQYRKFLLAFLEKFSFTLLTIFALASFGGLSNYAQLLFSPVRFYRLTDDEKFVLSLLAANSHACFRGVANNFSYANVEVPGDTDVFMPIHAAAFAYRPARSHDLGEVRAYHDDAEDNYGDFLME